MLLVCAACERDTQLLPVSAVAPKVVASSVAPPPPARTMDFADTLHGVVVPDPYRWLEDTTSAETQAWMKSQVAYTDSVINRLQWRDSLGAGLEARYAAAPTLGEAVQASGRMLLTRYLGPAASLWSIDSGAAQEREIISGKTLTASTNGGALRNFVPSFDGRRIALGTTKQGDADAAITIV
ncbi:MAG: hypothetical protein ABI120_21640, partial [Gemmatimonadaceae bacterium]